MATCDVMEFPKKLAMLMQLRGVNQSSLSRLTEIPQTTISNLLKRSRPGIDVGLKLAKALNVSLDYLADDSQDHPPASAEDAGIIMAVVNDLGLSRAEVLRRLYGESEPHTARGGYGTLIRKVDQPPEFPADMRPSPSNPVSKDKRTDPLDTPRTRRR